MAIGPWDPTNAATPGQAHFLASDADREHAVDLLKAAFVYGALTRDELTARTARALTARTYAELAAITGGLAPARPQHKPPARRARARARKRVNNKVVAWSTVAVVLSAALGVSFLTFYGGFLVMMLLFFAGAVLCSKPPAPPRAPLAKSIGGKH